MDKDYRELQEELHNLQLLVESPSWRDLETVLNTVIQNTATDMVNRIPGEFYGEQMAYSMGTCYGMKWGLEYINTKLEQVKADMALYEETEGVTEND